MAVPFPVFCGTSILPSLTTAPIHIRASSALGGAAVHILVTSVSVSVCWVGWFLFCFVFIIAKLTGVR